MKKYQKYITKGIVQNLSNIPFHNLSNAPLKRLLMMDKKSVPESNSYISIHIINNLPKKISPYCELHNHGCDEINLIISEDKELIYKIQLENETYKVISPSTIFIPKGIKHKAEVLSGKGIFVSILLNGTYSATK